MEITLIVLAVLVVLAIFFVVGFNRLRTMNIRVDEAESGIDVALKRGFDLIPNLVETVKGTPPTRSRSSRPSPRPGPPDRPRTPSARRPPPTPS